MRPAIGISDVFLVQHTSLWGRKLFTPLSDADRVRGSFSPAGVSWLMRTNILGVFLTDLSAHAGRKQAHLVQPRESANMQI